MNKEREIQTSFSDNNPTDNQQVFTQPNDEQELKKVLEVEVLDI